MKNNKEKINKQQTKTDHIQQKQKEINNLKQEIENLKKEKIDLLAKNVNLETNIKNLRDEVNHLNSEFTKQVNEKSIKAQKILDEKLKEYQNKFELESKEIKKYALANSALSLINIINQFNKMINHPTDNPAIKNYLAGLKMLSNMFNNWLNEQSIVELNVKPGDIYDSNIMDAIDIEGNPKNGTHYVKKILESGYKLHDRVILPTKVLVEVKHLKN